MKQALTDIFSPRGIVVILGVIGGLALFAAAFYLVGVVWFEQPFKTCLSWFVMTSFVVAAFIGWAVYDQLKSEYLTGWREGREVGRND